MKSLTNMLLSYLFLFFFLCAVSTAGYADDVPGSVSASTNVPGADFPKITPDLRVEFQIKAPGATKIEFDLDKRYEAVRSSDGTWRVTTDPQTPGFHYYWLVIDGVQVNDPASESFYGVGKQSSGIEIPESGVDYYSWKQVAHGDIREKWYFSNSTQAWRRVYIYAPPHYDVDTSVRYPVLYLQHGGGEDERGWPNQGHVAQILDNLIATGQAKPMLVVMGSGYAQRPADPPVPTSPPPASAKPVMTPPNFATLFGAFDDVVANDLVPTIDATYRTIPDRDHRAIAGLSMGGMQAFTVALNHPELFSYIGGFSGAGGGFGGPFDINSAYNGILAKPGAFNQSTHLVYLALGTKEPQ